MKLLLAADNPGGANILACLFAPARARGHQLVLRPSGAARAVWGAGPEAGDAFPDGVDLVVTGTSFGDAERLVWREAAERGVRSLAVIDSWTNFELRFRMADGAPCWPDMVAVPDAWVRNEVMAFAPAAVTVEVVGQPHLEASTRRLREARAGHVLGATYAWVSEPVAEDFPGNTRGFDQYQVFAQLMAAWPAHRLICCPHPREDRARWRALAGELADVATAELLPRMDGVIGMTSMVLVEAALAGIPALSLQPGRTGPCHPLVDRLCPVVTDPAGIAPALARFLAGEAPPAGGTHEAHDFLDGATRRLLDLIERQDKGLSP